MRPYIKYPPKTLFFGGYCSPNSSFLKKEDNRILACLQKTYSIKKFSFYAIKQIFILLTNGASIFHGS